MISYKKNPQLAASYDAIIIGSGMGSLTTAALFSKQGKRVLVLEKHYTAGGFTHVFKRKGYEWDVGIHYIGELQRTNSLLRKLFDHITNGELKWADMGAVYDRIVIGDKAYDFVKGAKNFKAKLKEYFPKDKEAIDSYVALVFAANKAMGKFYLSKAIPNLMNRLIGKRMRKGYYQYSDRTTYEVLRELTDNEELIKVLTGQYGDYGLPPKQSSFAMHASVARHYFGGGSFPVGGSSRIAETIDAIIEDAGGALVINAEVASILVEKGRAKGVVMADGKEFKCPLVISGAGIMTTYKRLLSETIQEKYGLTEHLQKIQPSVAHACLYIGLKGSPQSLELPKTNLWIYPDDLDHDACVARYTKDIDAPFPLVYISFPSAKDPDWTNRYPDRSTIDVITLMPWEEFEDWQGSRWMKRGESYESKKQQISERLLNVLFEQLPQLKDKVDCYELSSPLTTQHFVNYSKGEIYGLDHTPKRFRQEFLKPRTPIKGLFLTGQDIVTAGVGGALVAGVLTASAITGKNYLKKLK